MVDNASTDSTTKLARSCWEDGPVPLRIIREAKLGLQCARERGLKEAKYDFIGFVDDDNWVAPDWVRVAYETLESDSSLGALGSICDPVFEEPELQPATINISPVKAAHFLINPSLYVGETLPIGVVYFSSTGKKNF